MDIRIEDRKIKNVHFESDNKESESDIASSLLDTLLDWIPNDGLSIITGVNGIGKTQVLKFLYTQLRNIYNKKEQILHSSRENYLKEPTSFASEQLNVLYIPSNFILKDNGGCREDIRNNFLASLDGEHNDQSRLSFIRRLREFYKNEETSSSNTLNERDKFQLSIIKKIKQEHPDQTKLKDKKILNLAKKYALESQSSIPEDTSISIFRSAFRAYKNLQEYINQMKVDHKDLLNFYTEQNKIGETDAISRDTLEYIFGEDHINKYKKFQLSKAWGRDKTPWEEVTEQLKNYPIFKHQLVNEIYFAPLNCNVRNLKDCYKFEQLSSGEQMILSVLAWQYCQRGYSASPNNGNLRRNDFKSDVILLDEPDRHFDPKLSKLFYQIIKETLVKELGIQVIMTTHRIDTIALAQDGEIFSIYKNDQDKIEISPSHKLLSMFRLTSNLREFTNHHHVVYTESRNDALFYEGVYKTLMAQCNDLRQNRNIAEWQEKGTVLDDLLSRRLQLSFMSVSDSGDGGGSCAKVINDIARDITAYRNLERAPTVSKFYDRIELKSPYGIVDNDYGMEHDFSKIRKAEGKNQKQELEDNDSVERVVILKRHSLENYICDPFILASVIDVFNNLEEKNFKDKGEIIEILTGINNNIENIESQHKLLNENVHKYFTYLLGKLKDNINRRLAIPENGKGALKEGKEKDTYKSISEKITSLEKESQNLVRDSIFDAPKKIVINGKVIEISYPSELFDLQGHLIANALFGGDVQAKKITRTITEMIFQEGLKYIPLDLIETMFELNRNVRIHIREVLKPEKPKLKWSEELKKINPSSEENHDAMKIEDYSSAKIGTDIDNHLPSSKKRKAGELDPQELESINRESPNEQRARESYTNNHDQQVWKIKTIYDNSLLNHNHLLTSAYKIAGMKAVNYLLELSQDKEVAEQILLAVDDIGVEKVLEILMSPVESSYLRTKQQTTDDPTLETIAKIKAIIGKESLSEITGWHQYISTALSNNPFSASATKVIQIIGNLVNNLEEWLDIGVAYESIDVENKVTIILSQLEHWFDFVASGTTFVGLPPRYPGFDPDDEPNGGTGGGSSGSQGLLASGDNGNQNEPVATFFVGLNITAMLDS